MVIYAQPRDDDPSQAADFEYFSQHPDATEYKRDLLPGEASAPLPPGTWVWVRRIGQAGRSRAFFVPEGGQN